MLDAALMEWLWFFVIMPLLLLSGAKEDQANDRDRNDR
jgi:hypothetical protein